MDWCTLKMSSKSQLKVPNMKTYILKAEKIISWWYCSSDKKIWYLCFVLFFFFNITKGFNTPDVLKMWKSCECSIRSGTALFDTWWVFVNTNLQNSCLNIDLLKNIRDLNSNHAAYLDIEGVRVWCQHNIAHGRIRDVRLHLQEIHWNDQECQLTADTHKTIELFTSCK